jgi:hypothetical protein
MQTMPAAGSPFPDYGVQLTVGDAAGNARVSLFRVRTNSQVPNHSPVFAARPVDSRPPSKTRKE